MVPNIMVSKINRCDEKARTLHSCMRVREHTNTHTQMRTHIYIHNFMNANFKQVFILIFY